MNSLLLAAALAAAPQAGGAPSNTVECTAARLVRFMSPMGISQSWPKAQALPLPLQGQIGTLLAGPRHVMDGYTQTLHVDQGRLSAYVVEQGGFAGVTRIYGPLPVAACPASAL